VDVATVTTLPPGRLRHHQLHHDRACPSPIDSAPGGAGVKVVRPRLRLRALHIDPDPAPAFWAVKEGTGKDWAKRVAQPR